MSTHNEPEFTDEQIKRLDDIQNAATAFLNVLAETDDIAYYLDDLYDVIEVGANILNDHGRRVRIPARVTFKDGRIRIVDWWEAEDDADVEHE